MPSVRMRRLRTGDLVSSAKIEARHWRVGREFARVPDATRVPDAARILDQAAVEIGRWKPRPSSPAPHEIFPERVSIIIYNLWF